MSIFHEDALRRDYEDEIRRLDLRVLELEEALREAAEAWPTPNRYSVLADKGSA